MATWVTLPVFAVNDFVTATQLNAIAGDLDLVGSLFFWGNKIQVFSTSQEVYPGDSSQYKENTASATTNSTSFVTYDSMTISCNTGYDVVVVATFEHDITGGANNRLYRLFASGAGSWTFEENSSSQIPSTIGHQSMTLVGRLTGLAPGDSVTIALQHRVTNVATTSQIKQATLVAYGA